MPFLGKKTLELWSAILRWKDKKFLRKNSDFKNIFSGKRCFVVATGPSIKNQNLKKLKGEIVISVSNFFVHPDFREISPEFHLFVPSHPPVTPEQYGAWFKEAEEIFPAGQKVLISITDKPIVEKFQAFKNQKVYYYRSGHKPLSPETEIDFTRSLPVIQTSVHIGIFLAFYAGAKEIYLLGCDHDWILHLNQTRHFYDEKESKLSNLKYNEWEGKDLEVEFQSYVNLWKIYKKIRKYAGKRDVSITNATDGGLLDVFPRLPLNEVIDA